MPKLIAPKTHEIKPSVITEVPQNFTGFGDLMKLCMGPKPPLKAAKAAVKNRESRLKPDAYYRESALGGG